MAAEDNSHLNNLPLFVHSCFLKVFCNIAEGNFSELECLTDLPVMFKYFFNTAAIDILYSLGYTGYIS